MSKPDSSSQREVTPPPILTIQVSRGAGWILLAALALVAALVILDIRSRQQDPPVTVPISAYVETPAPVPAPAEPVKKLVAQVSRPVNASSIEVTSSEVTTYRESSPAPVIKAPDSGPSEREISSESVVAVEPLVVGTTGPVTLNGAGAVFPNLIYEKWFSEFHKLDANVQINYQAIGSGGGIRQVLAGTVDFGASDSPMSDEQLAQMHAKVLHIPTVLGAVVPIYNVPGVGPGLRFTPEILAGIFLGKITSWNHPAIASVNRHANLPDLPVIVVHRSDGNGSTLVFTDYLSKVSGEWQSQVGQGTSVKWPIGLAGKGNEGVAGVVHQLQGAVGYIDLIYALQNDVPFGSVKNSSGTFVKATLESVTEAARSVPEMSNDLRVSITNGPGGGSYPISYFTWLLVPQTTKDAERGKVLALFLRWMIDDGEAMAKGLGYARLPGNIASQVRKKIAQLR